MLLKCQLSYCEPRSSLNAVLEATLESSTITLAIDTAVMRDAISQCPYGPDNLSTAMNSRHWGFVSNF